MTLSLDRLTQYLLVRLGSYRSGHGKTARLDVSALSEHDLRDLNLPPDVRNRLTAWRDANDTRRGFW